MPGEEVLDGGNLSRVVRIGNTVRRSVGAWTPAVHALLNYLETVGFEHSPRVLGLDAQGREILTFIEGRSVGSQRPFPDWVWRDETIQGTAKTLRSYHDTVREFREPKGARWRMNWGPQRDDEMICHFDVAPYNIVLRTNGDVALIDWDVAAPGTAMLELAKTVNAFLPIYDHGLRKRINYRDGTLEGEMLDLFVARVRLFLDVYGLEDRTTFVGHMLDAAEHTESRIRRGARAGDVAVQDLLDSGITAHVMQTYGLIAEHREVLERALR